MDTNPNPGNMKIAEHHTTRSAWVVVAAIIAGFIVGGIALIYWIWPMFWAAVGIVVVAMIGGRAINIMDQVSEYPTGTDVAFGARQDGPRV